MWIDLNNLKMITEEADLPNLVTKIEERRLSQQRSQSGYIQ